MDKVNEQSPNLVEALVSNWQSPQTFSQINNGTKKIKFMELSLSHGAFSFVLFFFFFVKSFSFLSPIFCRWSRRLIDWEAAVAAAAAVGSWEGIMVVVVVGGNGGQPCRALQRLELERTGYTHQDCSPCHSLSPSPIKSKQLHNPSFLCFQYVYILFFFSSLQILQCSIF